MKAIAATILSLVVTGTQALAAGGADAEGMGLLATFFIAFAVLVILFQFLPGATLFVGILKGLFSSEVRKSVKEAADRSRTAR